MTCIIPDGSVKMPSTSERPVFVPRPGVPGNACSAATRSSLGPKTGFPDAFTPYSSVDIAVPAMDVACVRSATAVASRMACEPADDLPPVAMVNGARCAPNRNFRSRILSRLPRCLHEPYLSLLLGLTYHVRKKGHVWVCVITARHMAYALQLYYTSMHTDRSTAHRSCHMLSTDDSTSESVDGEVAAR
jgi:hypothetical protein